MGSPWEGAREARGKVWGVLWEGLGGPVGFPALGKSTGGTRAFHGGPRAFHEGGQLSMGFPWPLCANV